MGQLNPNLIVFSLSKEFYMYFFLLIKTLQENQIDVTLFLFSYNIFPMVSLIFQKSQVTFITCYQVYN